MISHSVYLASTIAPRQPNQAAALASLPQGNLKYALLLLESHPGVHDVLFLLMRLWHTRPVSAHP